MNDNNIYEVDDNLEDLEAVKRLYNFKYYHHEDYSSVNWLSRTLDDLHFENYQIK